MSPVSPLSTLRSPGGWEREGRCGVFVGYNASHALAQAKASQAARHAEGEAYVQRVKSEDFHLLIWATLALVRAFVCACVVRPRLFACVLDVLSFSRSRSRSLSLARSLSRSLSHTHRHTHTHTHRWLRCCNPCGSFSSASMSTPLQTTRLRSTNRYATTTALTSNRPRPACLSACRAQHQRPIAITTAFTSMPEVRMPMTAPRLTTRLCSASCTGSPLTSD